MEDPHAILGVPPGAPPDEVAAAYRALAKQLHPDVAGDDRERSGRMAEVNAAYDQLRGPPATPGAAGGAPGPSSGRQSPAGAWLADPVRRSLGAELLVALEDREPVHLVTAATTWASPRALVAVTDRRLLWLLDDAVMHRVRTLRFRDVLHTDVRLAWPRRRHATVRLHTRDGRRHAFSHLRPAVATEIARRIAGA